MPALIVSDGRVMLRARGLNVPVSALSIFRIAIRGVRDIDGLALDEAQPVTTSSIFFNQQPSEVALALDDSSSGPSCRPVIKHRGSWELIRPIELDDHVLIGSDWYPLDVESLGNVGHWLESRGQPRGLTAATYIDLYRGTGPGFKVVDRLSDATVASLRGGSASTHGLVANLYPYQSAGLTWLSARAQAGFGAILADEMGLGKTLQIIGLLAQRPRSLGQPDLVVVPLTLVENWSRELARFAPTLPVYRHVGGGRTRRPTEIAKSDVVLTTYETVVSDQAVLELVPWDLVILDEAQAIKNPGALRSQAVKALPRAAGIAVTGTPLENRTLDIWSLASFSIPGYLGDREVFAAHLEEDPGHLRLAIRPILLRREVSEVAEDLPEKLTIDVPMEMFGPESSMYDTLIGAARQESKTPVLALITRLRQFTAHPSLVPIAAGPMGHESAKFTRLLEIVDEIVATGEKALIFVAFTQAADLILKSVGDRTGVPAWTLDGRTRVRDRQPTIDRFSSVKGPAVLILNPVAGGVGLNIQAASHVIHYTLEWNPAKEAQATARAWRRGQLVPVTVHRLYYVNSIDEFILDKLNTKQELINQVVTPSDETSTLRDLLGQSLQPRGANSIRNDDDD